LKIHLIQYSKGRRSILFAGRDAVNKKGKKTLLRCSGSGKGGSKRCKGDVFPSATQRKTGKSEQEPETRQGTKKKGP